ncbi:hypothetical protein NX722_07975 [Endozoicomonas gorgoniicola]|uniref:Uncharacterized protein n=1 Tax=Endozoicomonas gorgoniicola TaxID=1234144 RepID=A0ABT3MT95_9GAMM|nr:hypothetical protein [Endozoicomonas gorgoniicola]MCW7552587.1 hypothetical protein [Endozoicomonas gorgoniicola]
MSCWVVNVGYITKIENNCILAELGSATDILGALFPALDSINIFMEFMNNIVDRIKYFRGVGKEGGVEASEVPYTKTECDRAADILKAVADNKDGQLGFSVIEYEEERADAKVKFNIKFTSDEALQARRGALLSKQALEQTSDADHKNVLMYFHQTNIDDPKADGRTGDKAVVKSLSIDPLSVFFLSEMDREKIRYLIHDKNQNPLKVSFNVDVNVETDKNDKPRFYRVSRVHEIYFDDED